MTSPRHARQVDAVMALLASLTDQQLQDVVERLKARGVVLLDQAGANVRRTCEICGKTYPYCRRLAQVSGDDHEFTPKN